MMVFEPHSHREVPPSFVCMLSTRICSLYASACGRWDMRGPSGLRKFSSVQFPSERALSRRQPTQERLENNLLVVAMGSAARAARCGKSTVLLVRTHCHVA